MRGSLQQESYTTTTVNIMGWNPHKVFRGIIYGAMHTNGRWYIGSSHETLDCRRHMHHAAALKINAPGGKFYEALKATKEDDWIWGVHEEVEDVTRQELHALEAEYQKAFNSVRDGYNSIHAKAEWSKSKAAQKKRHDDFMKVHRDEYNAHRRAQYAAGQRCDQRSEEARERARQQAKKSKDKRRDADNAKRRAKRAADEAVISNILS